MNEHNDSLDQLKRAALLRLLKQRGATRVIETAPDDITGADREGPLALSFAQQRLWFLDQLDPTASAAYHIPASLVLRGALDRTALRTPSMVWWRDMKACAPPSAATANIRCK
ncbi:hypothetical protein QZH47_03630 [Pseudomonas corrugata]